MQRRGDFSRDPLYHYCDVHYLGVMLSDVLKNIGYTTDVPYLPTTTVSSNIALNFS